MSEVLARIRVRETAGIRRFLYPMSIRMALPDKTEASSVCLITAEGNALPLQMHPYDAEHYRDFRLDFAMSLEPFATQELDILTKGPQKIVDDPFSLTFPAAGSALQSRQNRVEFTIGKDGFLRQVVYDQLAHLRFNSLISRNSTPALEQNYPELRGGATLAGWVEVTSEYPDGCKAVTRTEITACKSWAMITHLLQQPKPNDEIVFSLPLAITSPTLTCDFGVGGSVFGKLDKNASEIVWRTDFGEVPHARWSVATAGRTDYVGEVETTEAFLPQRWFHLVDSDKALAVAITKVPENCREMTVRLTHEGDVTIAFRLGDTVAGPEEFGICYHFLNDVPAIAAATNPQSILLPPIVEVLPV